MRQSLAHHKAEVLRVGGEHNDIRVFEECPLGISLDVADDSRHV